MKHTIQVSLFFIALALGYSCSPGKHPAIKEYSLTAGEKRMCDSLQLDSTLIREIRLFNTNRIEPFHYSFGGEQDTTDSTRAKGLIVREQSSKSYELIFYLKSSFRKKGYSIFLLENNFNFDKRPDHIGVLKTTDQYAVLKQVGTDGINYRITNDSLIRIIRQFDKKYALELVGASGDWCDFVIANEPKDWKAFATEVYKICPDVVDQGTGTIAALAEEMKARKRLFLWWD